MSTIHKKVKTAVILAAGMGTRLRSIIGEHPKGALEIGGSPLIIHSLQKLQKAGISKIFLVVGYKRDNYDKLLADVSPVCELIENPDYRRTGSMHSLYLAKELLNEDFLLLESDILYEFGCLSALLDTPSANAVLLSALTGAGDEVYVYGSAGRLSAISKLKKASQLLGELVGISKISCDLYKSMCSYYEHHVPFPAQYHYEDCLSDISQTQVIPVLKHEQLVWTEIDDPSHYQRAVNVVYPLIVEKEKHLDYGN